MQDETTSVFWWATRAGKTGLYYMPESARGQDKANPAFWLATRVGEMGPFCPLGILRVGPARKTSLFGHIINPLFTKLVLALFAFLSTSRTRLISSHLDLAQFYIKSKIYSVLQVIDSATLCSLKVRSYFQFLWERVQWTLLYEPRLLRLMIFHLF